MWDRRVYDNVSEAVGRTPLVRLHDSVRNVPGEVFAKLEFMNPMGSIKDRVARYMVEKARRDGRLRDGSLIIESSSGNTAMGLGMMAIVNGYRCRVAVRDRTSKEKLDAMAAIGLEVELVPSDLPPEDPNSYNRVMERMCQQNGDAFFPDQHNNRENNEAHYYGTGPEIWDQMDGRIDYLVAGMGTGGTICGAGRYLKERDPRIQVIAVDPVGSIFHDYFHHKKIVKPAPYLVEGLGDETLIDCVDWSVLDDVMQVSDRDSFLTARDLVASEAILGGGSSGSALWGVRQLGKRLEGPARIVTIFPDGAGRYMTKIFDDEWMSERGFLDRS